MDIGSGPTLYQVLSGCEVFSKVLLTDFLEVNRQELRRWLQDEGGCGLDWTPYLQHVCELEGRRYGKISVCTTFEDCTTLFHLCNHQIIYMYISFCFLSIHLCALSAFLLNNKTKKGT